MGRAPLAGRGRCRAAGPRRHALPLSGPCPAEPGSCPPCGVEPARVALGDEGRSPERAAPTRCFRVGAVRPPPPLVPGMAPSLGAIGVGGILGGRGRTCVELVMAGLVVPWPGSPAAPGAQGPSQATMRSIGRNPSVAPIADAAGVPVAAGLLYPFLGIPIGPILAAFATRAASPPVGPSGSRPRTFGVCPVRTRHRPSTALAPPTAAVRAPPEARRRRLRERRPT